MKTSRKSRRNFIKTTAAGTAGLAMSMSAKSYARIIGANDRVNFAVIGLNGRGQAHISAIQNIDRTVSLTALCDVDTRIFPIIKERFPGDSLDKTETYQDFRKVLEHKEIDAVTIATPDHWHVPMAILAMQAGKHVYLEKPVSHNPAEGEMLLETEAKTGKVIQIGNQQRSAPTSQQAIADIRAGLIGEVYFAKAWYARKRGSIGVGQPAGIPEGFDWDLWQGPAPRKEFKDNYVHYNWHWFEQWGTGEVNNNGLHELDICRWALGVDLPDKLISTGGRYHFKDDWEFYDTQKVDYIYGENKLITWEGLSCHNLETYNRGRGTMIFETKGSILLDRNGYLRYDLDGKLVNQMDEKGISATTNIVGIGYLDLLHMENFTDAVQKGTKLHSPVKEANTSTLLCHLANISQKLGKAITLDPKSGKPDDPDVKNHWGRTYHEAWIPKV